MKVYHLEYNEDTGKELCRKIRFSPSKKHILKAMVMGYYHGVALVDEDMDKDVEANLEKAFRLTNHIEGAWWDNADVQLLGSAFNPQARSTSVGDVVETNDGEFYVVMGIGFAII